MEQWKTIGGLLLVALFAALWARRMINLVRLARNQDGDDTSYKNLEDPIEDIQRQADKNREI